MSRLSGPFTRTQDDGSRKARLSPRIRSTLSTLAYFAFVAAFIHSHLCFSVAREAADRGG